MRLPPGDLGATGRTAGIVLFAWRCCARELILMICKESVKSNRGPTELPPQFARPRWDLCRVRQSPCAERSGSCRRGTWRPTTPSAPATARSHCYGGFAGAHSHGSRTAAACPVLCEISEPDCLCALRLAVPGRCGALLAARIQGRQGPSRCHRIRGRGIAVPH